VLAIDVMPLTPKKRGKQVEDILVVCEFRNVILNNYQDLPLKEKLILRLN